MDFSDMDFPNSVTSQLLEEYNKKMKQIIMQKFAILTDEAFRQGEYELYTILRNIELRNIEKTKLELEEKGYYLELEQPKAEFTNNGYIFKATFGDVKLKVKKIILEV